MSTKISVTSHLEKDELTIAFQGKIDSSNAPALEEEIQKIVSENPASSIVLDFDGLEYTTSAGLRVILRLRQQVSDTSIVNATLNVFFALTESPRAIKPATRRETATGRPALDTVRSSV